MKTNVIIEQPIFILESSDWNGSVSREIYVSDLQKANVGDIFIPHNDSNCGRAKKEEKIEIVYKTENGVGVLYRCYGTTDSPNPREWENDPELFWIELHK